MTMRDRIKTIRSMNPVARFSASHLLQQIGFVRSARHVSSLPFDKPRVPRHVDIRVPIRFFKIDIRLIGNPTIAATLTLLKSFSRPLFLNMALVVRIPVPASRAAIHRHTHRAFPDDGLAHWKVES